MFTAFHEAFADLVALFQRFSYPGVLESEIAKTRGDLSSETMLAQTGRAVRSGNRAWFLVARRPWRDQQGNRRVGGNETRPRSPSNARQNHTSAAPTLSRRCSARLRLSTSDRVADLYRISTQGTGVLPEGDIHPDLCQPPCDRSPGDGRSCAAHVHPGDRLLPAGRHHLR